MRILWSTLVAAVPLTTPWIAHAQDRDTAETLTLAQAIELAGTQARTLPIKLAATRDPSTSENVQAWTTYGEDGRPVAIFVYTRSPVFQCANRHPNPLRQCRLELASAIVHEVWHYRNSRDESEAYLAQITFLIGHGASSKLVGAVQRAREQVLARQRRLAEAVRKAREEGARPEVLRQRAESIDAVGSNDVRAADHSLPGSIR